MSSLKHCYHVLLKNKGGRKETARELGITTRGLQQKINHMQAAGWEVPSSPYMTHRLEYVHQQAEALEKAAEPEYEVRQPPPADMSIGDLLEHRKRAFRLKKAHEEGSKLIPVDVKLEGPIGILHFGDPHVDDDGTDIELLEAHVRLVNATEGLFAGNVGDTTNNWIGRLARLYAEQATSASQAWMLAEWLLKSTRWLYIIGGNHDLWSGAGDPLRWIAKGQNDFYAPSECRLQLRFPNARAVRVNVRHDFAGASQWNPAHGPMKAAQMGTRDHLFTCGHKHKSAYGVLKDPDSGITMHAVQVGSYKIYDRYAKEKGFRDQQLSPSCLTVIDPSLPDTHPDLIKCFWDAQVGADYLAWLRKRSKKKAA